MPGRILVTGDRNYADRSIVYAALDRLMPVVVIQGMAPGADTLAADWAEARGVKCLAFPALWKQYGRAAGPIRNQQMLVEGQPDLVVYFHDNLDESKGTADMVRQSRKAGVEVRNGREVAGV